MHKLELLAPAGNFDCLVAAVQSGADAVYLSGKAFGARSFADNFNNDEIEKAIDYCHIRGVKVYVTVNTLVFDSEFEKLSAYLGFLNRVGVDGIIVQDMGVFKATQCIAPNLPIHASTQMTIYNKDGVKFLENSGIKRVVLAREVSLSGIEEISKNTGAELEVFGHGALCMCYSGQCLLSSIIGGRSGNRGKCAQPCRLMYSINSSTKKAFYLSLKDLSSLSHIENLKNAGISSLKIEGRMKGPAYVAAVVGIYRKYIDNPHPAEEEDLHILDMIFNRGGLTDGYLTQKKGPDMFAFDKPDDPYRKGKDDQIKELLNILKNDKRKTKISCSAEIKKDKFPKIVLTCNNVTIEYIGDKKPEMAQKSPITAEGLKEQLLKTGGTPFIITDISINLDDGLFLSLGDINELRRNAVSMFEEEYLKSFRREDVNADLPIVENKSFYCDAQYVCEVTSKEQFDAVKVFPYKLFYVPLHIIIKYYSEVSDYRERIVVVPPSIVEESHFEKIKKLLEDGFYGVLATNVSLVERFKKYRVLGGFRLNISNSFALEFYKGEGLFAAELSPELTIKQIRNLKKSIPVQIMVYGRLPLMITENCVIKNGGRCSCDGKNTITDRMGMEFPVIKDGEGCRSVILNCKKTFAPLKNDEIKNAGIDFCRVYFTDESAEECIGVSQNFLNDISYRPEDFTNGHFIKGVL